MTKHVKKLKNSILRKLQEKCWKGAGNLLGRHRAGVEQIAGTEHPSLRTCLPTACLTSSGGCQASCVRGWATPDVQCRCLRVLSGDVCSRATSAEGTPLPVGVPSPEPCHPFLTPPVAQGWPVLLLELLALQASLTGALSLPPCKP